MFNIKLYTPVLIIFRFFKHSRQNLTSGTREFLKKTISRTDVDSFCALTGDSNPVHSMFGEKSLVNGAFLNAIVSGVIGSKLPGPGTIVVSQSMRFPKPCFVGDSVEVMVEISEVRKIISCTYQIVREEDKSVVMEGEAKLVLKL